MTDIWVILCGVLVPYSVIATCFLVSNYFEDKRTRDDEILRMKIMAGIFDNNQLISGRFECIESEIKKLKGDKE